MHPNINPLISCQLIFLANSILRRTKKSNQDCVCLLVPWQPSRCMLVSSRVHLSFGRLLHLLLLCVQATRPSVWAEHYLTKGRTIVTIFQNKLASKSFEFQMQC